MLQSQHWKKGALVMLWYHIYFCSIVAVYSLKHFIYIPIFFRFKLKSAETGLIASCYDIAQCIVLLFVTYVGARGHQPVWLGSGIIIMGIGSVLLSLPRFVAPLYEIANITDGICDLNRNNTVDICLDSNLRNFRYCINCKFLKM